MPEPVKKKRRTSEDLFVTKQADTFEQAVSDGIDTLKVQIEKYKNA